MPIHSAVTAQRATMPFVSTYQHLTMPVPCLRSMPGERETALLLVAHDSVRDYFWAVHAPFQVPDVMQIPWRLHPAAARKCCRARVSRPATLLPANTAALEHRSRTRTQLHAHVRSTPPTHWRQYARPRSRTRVHMLTHSADRARHGCVWAQPLAEVRSIRPVA